MARELLDAAHAVVFGFRGTDLVAEVATVVRVKARVLERALARVERAVRHRDGDLLRINLLPSIITNSWQHPYFKASGMGIVTPFRRMTTDRRRHMRAYVYAPGAIVVGKALAVDCIIRDLSTSGTSIQIANTAGIPDNFDLQFKRADGEALDCRVAWRTPNRLGVCFTQIAAAMSSRGASCGRCAE